MSEFTYLINWKDLLILVDLFKTRTVNIIIFLNRWNLWLKCLILYKMKYYERSRFLNITEKWKIRKDTWEEKMKFFRMKKWSLTQFRYNWRFPIVLLYFHWKIFFLMMIPRMAVCYFLLPSLASSNSFASRLPFFFSSLASCFASLSSSLAMRFSSWNRK